jgi:hypothetical protein
MKTIWVLTSALTVLGFVTSQARAQEFGPGMRPAFGPIPQAPRPDLKPFVPFVPGPSVGNNGDKKDRQYHLPWTHLIPHGASGATPGSGIPEKPYMKPTPSMVPGESFSPHAQFNIPTRLPEISASRLSMPRGSWFRWGSGGGILAGIGGGIAALFGALFGRKKKTDS